MGGRGLRLLRLGRRWMERMGLRVIRRRRCDDLRGWGGGGGHTSLHFTSLQFTSRSNLTGLHILLLYFFIYFVYLTNPFNFNLSFLLFPSHFRQTKNQKETSWNSKSQILSNPWIPESQISNLISQILNFVEWVKAGSGRARARARARARVRQSVFH